MLPRVRRSRMPDRMLLAVACAPALLLLSASCQSVDGCFCCNNCLTNYFLDVPKGQAADALYRQEDWQGCVEKSNELRSPTAYQKIIHAKCLEGAGHLEQAATLYREVIAGDPQGVYSPAREAMERLATLGQRAQPRSPFGWPSLAEPPRAVGGGERDAAVVVGISEPFVLPPVPGAAENATDWYRWLTAGLGVAPDRVTLLRNGEATRESMLDAARRAALAAEGGRVWFVFVGHGAPALSGDDGILLGADAQATEESLAARGVAERELLAALQGGRAKSVVAVIDACFSGMTPDGSTPLVAGSQATVPVRRTGLAQGVAVLSSSERVAGPLPRGDRPAYSYLVLGALFGWADADIDGRVTAIEAHHYAERVLRAAVTGRDQSPQLATREQGMLLARSGGASAPDVAAIVAGDAARF